MNRSSNNTSNISQSSPWVSYSQDEVILGSFAFALVILIAFVGNALTCLAVYYNQSLRTTLNLSIISLAVSDILMALFVMPLSLVSLIKGQWIFGHHMCSFQFISLFALAAISIETMAWAALSRYFRIVRPNTFKKYFTSKTCVAVLLLIWFITFCAVATVSTTGKGYVFKFNPHTSFCLIYVDTSAEVIVTNFIISAFGLIPAFIIFFSYFKIFRFIKQHNQAVAPTLHQANAAASGNSAINAEDVRLTKVLFVVLMGFLGCWAPVFLLRAIIVISVKSAPPFLKLSVTLFLFTSSAVNPLIYGVMNKRFRQEFKKMLCCILTT